MIQLFPQCYEDTADSDSTLPSTLDSLLWSFTPFSQNGSYISKQHTSFKAGRRESQNDLSSWVSIIFIQEGNLFHFFCLTGQTYVTRVTPIAVEVQQAEQTMLPILISQLREGSTCLSSTNCANWKPGSRDEWGQWLRQGHQRNYSVSWSRRIWGWTNGHYRRGRAHFCSSVA